jgi:hypothetical protein
VTGESPCAAIASAVGTASSPTQHRPSPPRATPISASTVRSPVPSEPSSRASGVTPVRSIASSPSSSASPIPAPPAPIWLARTAIAARTTSTGSGAPPPPAWLRTSRHWWSPGGSSADGADRRTPTPVLVP